VASDDDVKTWQTLPILKDLTKELAAKAEKAGIPNGQQFVDDIEKFMKEASQK